MTHDTDPEFLRRYYKHECRGCDSAWVIEIWTTIYQRRKRDHALVEIEEKWRPLSAIPLPLQDRAASLMEDRYQRHDISLLRATNIHTGDYIMAFLLLDKNRPACGGTGW